MDYLREAEKKLPFSLQNITIVFYKGYLE